MCYKLKNEIYFSTRMSQINSNILGLKITEKRKEIKIILIDVEPFPLKNKNLITKKNVLDQVFEIWDLKVKKYYISEIHYAPNDSPSDYIYKSLTQKIINCIVKDKGENI